MAIIFYLNNTSTPYPAEQLHFKQDMPAEVDYGMGARYLQHPTQFDCTLEVDLSLAVELHRPLRVGTQIRICSDAKEYNGVVKEMRSVVYCARLRIMFDK